MKNKLISAVLSAVMIGSAMVQGVSALSYGEEWAGYKEDSTQIYSDIPQTHWAFDAIKRSSETKWFNGYPDGTFRPNNSINRAEGMKVFVTFLGLQLNTVTESSYYDVEPSAWYAPYIEAGKKLYVEKAAFNGDVPFNPEMPLTREDAIHALVIALKYNNEVEFADQSVLNMFSDANSISANLKAYVATAINKQLVSGMDDGTIRAQDPLTRAQFATLLYRASMIGYGTGGGLADIQEPQQPETASVVSVSITPVSKTINIGESFAVTAQATMSDGTTADYTQKLTLSADNANVTVSGNTVTGVQAGTSVIKFTGDNLVADKTVSVTVNEVAAANGKVSGKVSYADRPEVGISGAEVKFIKNGTVIKSVLTDDNGQYNEELQAGSYRITASYRDYSEGQVSVEITENNTTYADTIFLTNDREGTISGKVYDAFVQDGTIAGVKIVFRQGGDTREGAAAAETVSNSDGTFSVTLPAGTYTAEASKEGYITEYKNLVSQSAGSEQNITLTPELGDGEWRFVLTWGEQPYDLDSHLTGPTVSGDRFHVYYSAKNAYANSEELANLDVDDITSYGPETVTIVKLTEGKYRYSIHDYTNRYSSNSSAMSNSNAVVKVYNGSNLIKTFHIPTNVEGTLWTVFELENNTITPINEISQIRNPSGITSAGEENVYDAGVILRSEEK